MFAKSTLVTMALLLTFGGITGAVPKANAAPLTQKASGDVEPTTASLIVDIHLPSGANRATAAGDLAKFDQALQEVARNNGGKISRTEVLAWAGDDAKSVISDVAKRMKESGYMVAEVSSFDSESGRITPLAALRGDKSDRVVGLWIEAEGNAVLVWGHLMENGSVAPAKVATPAKATKTAAVTKKATTAPKKVVTATKSTKTTAKSASTGETAAQRQAKAMKAYQDYQYVKLMGPISGSMYRSSKW